MKTKILKIALVPSTVAAITFESSEAADVIVTSDPVAADVSPMSISKSLEDPTIVIEAVIVPQDELLLPESQFKSTSLLPPVKLMTP